MSECGPLLSYRHKAQHFFFPCQGFIYSFNIIYLLTSCLNSVCAALNIFAFDMDTAATDTEFAGSFSDNLVSIPLKTIMIMKI